MTPSLHHILKTLWDICFPPSKDELLVRSLTPTHLGKLFSLRYTEGVWNLSSFNHPFLRALLHEAKFHGNKKAQELLATLLVHLLKEKTSLASHLWLPIPLSKTRFRERGYNQVLEVLHALPKGLGIQVRTDCLLRTRHTKSQTDLQRAERLRNVIGAFTVTKPELIQGNDIVILDDVTTTGATLRAAQAAILSHHPNSVTLVALAH